MPVVVNTFAEYEENARAARKSNMAFDFANHELSARACRQYATSLYPEQFFVLRRPGATAYLHLQMTIDKQERRGRRRSLSKNIGCKFVLKLVLRSPKMVVIKEDLKRLVSGPQRLAFLPVSVSYIQQREQSWCHDIGFLYDRQTRAFSLTLTKNLTLN